MSAPNPYSSGPTGPHDPTAQFPAAPAIEPAPKKKKGWKKWAGITVGALLVIGVASGMGDSEEETATAATESSPTSSSVQNLTAETEEDASEPEDAAATLQNSAAENETDTSDSPDIPAEFRSALNQANGYANRMDMSRQRVYDQLTSEYGGQFSAEAAQYAIDNVEADWNANALAKARNYQDRQNMSPDRIRDQLTSEYGEQFTAAEADYALANLNAGGDGGTSGVSAEFSSALAKAESYATNQHMSKQRVHDQLTSEYGEQFSAEAAQYAIDNVEADWNANALAKARNYQDRQNMSPDRIRDQLTSEYGEQFTAAEADYALANL